MKKAEIYSTATATPPGYVWKWRAVSGKTESALPFVYYHDCLSDARAKGYEVELASAHGETAPGGARHNIP